MTVIFPWKRFWCPPEGKIELDSLGFLADPEGEYGKYSNPDVVDFEKIHEIPCLILLGEPGIGKSQAVQDEIENLIKIAAPNEELNLYLNLKEYGSEDHLRKDLFESETWESFIHSDKKLHLFVDSLDEVRLRFPLVQSLILSGLNKSPIERLSFRITCRTADWPWSFTESLSALWGAVHVKVYELVPLRYRDVQKAAHLAASNPEKFLNAIVEKKAGPLAAKPVTFNLFLKLYQRDGHLPESQNELYEKGCLYLCEEPDRERRERGEIDKRYLGLLSSEQRLSVASRIAAALIYSNYFSVYKGLDQGDLPEGCITIPKISGGKEKAPSGILDLSEDAIRETLRTGLFTSRGVDMMGFAHQTYAEFLAARYVIGAASEQVKSLLSHPHDNNKLIPQLHETAAWISAQRPDILSWIVSIEPQILLRSDVSKADDSTKKDLVGALLKRFLTEDLMDDRDFREHYKKLRHPELAEQLAPIIKDKAIFKIPRNIAIEMAAACNCKELQNILADIALDQSDDYHLRTAAAEAVSVIADDAVKKRLELLAEGNAGEDPDRELRAYGMRCVWPKLWTTVRLLKNIVIPSEKFSGAYNRFLRYEFIPQLPPPDLANDLPTALSIIKKWPFSRQIHDLLGIISDEIIIIAWEYIPEKKIMKELAEIILSRMNELLPIVYGESKLWDSLKSKEDKRRSIAKFLIEGFDISEKTIDHFTFGDTPVILDSDFLWVLEQIETAKPGKKEIWANCIMETLRYEHPVSWIDRFLEVRLQEPILQTKYSTFLSFESEIYRKTKANYLNSLRWKQRREKMKQTKATLSIYEMVETELEAIKSGDIGQWHSLTYHLSVDIEQGVHIWPSSIQGTSGWKTLDEKTHQRIKEAALILIKKVPQKDEWFGKGTYTWEIASIYLALRLIADNKSDIDGFSIEDWRRVVPYMIDCPIHEDNYSRCLLLRIAQEKVPDEAKDYFARLIDGENERHGNIFFIDHYADCWNEVLTEVVLQKLRLGTLKPDSFRNLIEFLNDKDVVEIEDIIVKTVNENKDKTNYKDLLAEAVALLLVFYGEKYWSLIWEILHEESETPENILSNIAHGTRHESKFIDNFSETHLADLYLLMNKKYAVREDPEIEGEVTPRMMLADLRNAVFMTLVNRGTRAACEAIASLAEKLPEDRHWIIWRLREAQENTLRKTWTPLNPTQIINLLQERNRRYVENEKQLMSVAIESLEKMQEYYGGEMTPLERLWNYDGGGNQRDNFRPKDEESLSDEIARWLKEDLGPSRGIVINREVQPRRGQKTDIYVNALRLDDNAKSSEILTVVIEVKGCWNDEVLTAMETQLLNQYMKTNNYECGIYLVGWYMCDKWAGSKDARKGKTPKLSLESFKEHFKKQSVRLNGDHNNSYTIETLILDLSLL